MPRFHPVIQLPETYEVFDFSTGYDPHRIRGLYGVGRYNEDRSGMYTAEIFSPGRSETARTIHIGVDLAAPVGADVFAFDEGEIFLTGINPGHGDYGGTIITKHSFEGRDLYALFGHLAHRSLVRWAVGQRFEKGTVLGFLGDENENGGWNPHVHFQLSWLKPSKCDMPGVVSIKDRDQALRDFPDPKLVLGQLYSDEARA